MLLGQRIDQRRKELGLSQSELARRARVPQTTLNSLIKGPARWSPHLVRIARELETTVAYLTFETDDATADFSNETLTSEERELVERFQGMPLKDRAALMQLARTISTSAASLAVYAKQHDYGGE